MDAEAVAQPFFEREFLRALEGLSGQPGRFDPCRNECANVFALVFGAIRGIPIYWRLIDGSFGVVGFVPMWLCHRWEREMEFQTEISAEQRS